MEKQKIIFEKPSDGVLVKVPPEHWDSLRTRDINQICENAQAVLDSSGILLDFLNIKIRIDVENKSIYQLQDGSWEKVTSLLQILVILVYLLSATSHTIEEKIVSVKELKDANFFQGPHELEIVHLIKKYGYDADKFCKAAEKLGAKPVDLADAAYMFMPFPKIPIYYLLWEGDEEFYPRISILFDKSIEKHLSADAIWGLVNLVSDYLLM